VAVIVETPRFRVQDLVSYPGYGQSAIAWFEYGIGIGAVYFTVGPLVAAMLPDTKWSLSVLSIALLIRGLVGIIAGPLTGILVHRHGVKPILLIGGVLTTVFTALTGTVHSPAEFALVFGVALAFADSFMGNIPSATIVQKWFLSRRAVVMGFVNSGAGFGGLIFAPVMSLLVREFGWRHACFALAGIILVGTIPALWLKPVAEEGGANVDGVEGRVIPREGHEDVIGTPQHGVNSIVRQPVFWMLCALFGIEAWALGTFAADQVIYLKTIGVSAVASSSALGAAAGIAAGSGILLSRLSDRISPYYVLIASMTSMLIGAVIVMNAHSVALVWAYSAFFGAGYGLFVPTIPVAMSRYFGAMDFTRALGFGQIAIALMGGLGPYVTARIVDHTGSFSIPIHLITGLLVAGVVIAALARPPKYALKPVKEIDTDGEPAATGTRAVDQAALRTEIG
jgi:MFS family permease